MSRDFNCRATRTKTQTLCQKRESMRMMKLVVFTVLMFVWICEGGVPSTLDVCSCASDGDTFDCRLVRGTRISASGCIGNLRTTGPGFVTDIENGLLDKFQRVIIERTTLNCDSVIGVRDDQYVVMDNVVCVGDSMTSTPTTTPRAQLTMVSCLFFKDTLKQKTPQTENISISLDKTARVRMQIWGRHQEYRRS